MGGSIPSRSTMKGNRKVWRRTEQVVGGSLIALFVFGLMLGCIGEITDTNSPAARRQSCLDRGGVVIEDQWGQFTGCEIHP